MKSTLKLEHEGDFSTVILKNHEIDLWCEVARFDGPNRQECAEQVFSSIRRALCFEEYAAQLLGFSKTHLIMIADLLEEFSDILGNQGCNDHWLPDTDENWQLIHEVQKENSNPDEWDTRKDITSERGLFVPNFCLPHHFARRIRRLVNERSEPESVVGETKGLASFLEKSE